MVWHDNPPGSIEDYPDSLLIPFRHLPDTVKSINVGVVKGISRKGSS